MFEIKQSAIGLDIADHTIEVVELSKTVKKAKILSMARAVLEPGIVERGAIKDQDKLKIILKKIFAEAKPNPIVGKRVIFGLSESQVYTHAFQLQELSKKKIQEALPRMISRVIPLPEDDIIFSYKVLKDHKTKNKNSKSADDKKKTDVVVVVASKRVVGEWQTFLKSMGFQIEAFDIESLALFRGVFSKKIKSPVAIIDIGSRTTNISFFDSLGLRYSQISHVAGEALTTLIMENDKIDFLEAEEQKKQLNLADGKHHELVQPVVDKLVVDIVGAVDFFEKKIGGEISELILVGGSSKIFGLAEYLNQSVGRSARIGSSTLLQGEVDIQYLEAIGLAWRGVEAGWDKSDPAIPLVKGLSKKTRKNSKKTSAVVQSAENKDLSDGHGSQQPKSDSSQVFQSIEKGNKIQIILLFAILAVGIVAIIMALSYRDQQRVERSQTQKESIGKMVENIPLVTDEEIEVEPSEDFVSSTVSSTGSVLIDEGTRVRLLEIEGSIPPLRESPSEASSIVEELSGGGEFELLEMGELNNWYKIKIGTTTTGWIAAGHVEIIDSQKDTFEVVE